jgi:hypothetical protein
MDTSEITAITLPLMFLGIAAAVASLLVVPFYLHHRTKDRARLYEMLKQAQESSHPFSPELIRQIVGSPPPTREKDIRRGAILLSIAVGLAIQVGVAYGMITDLEARNSVIALLSPVISVLGCVGLTLLALGLMLRRPGAD